MMHDASISLKSYMLQEVRTRIIDGRYKPGQRLSESTLAHELSTSRAPVHDAFLTLRGEGLVQVYPQRGSYVFNPTDEESLALCEVSAVYEIGALTLAMEHNPDKLCDLLGEQVLYGEKALENNDMPAWASADRSFHQMIITLSGNVFLADAYKTISSRIATLVHRLPSSRKRIAASVEQHRAILNMICQRDHARAAEQLRSNNLAVAALLKK